MLVHSLFSRASFFSVPPSLESLIGTLYASEVMWTADHSSGIRSVSLRSSPLGQPTLWTGKASWSPHWNGRGLEWNTTGAKVIRVAVEGWRSLHTYPEVRASSVRVLSNGVVATAGEKWVPWPIKAMPSAPDPTAVGRDVSTLGSNGESTARLLRVKEERRVYCKP